MDNNRKIQKRVLTAIPVLVLMAVIFAFSAKTAGESMENSDVVVDIILELGPERPAASEPDRGELYQALVVVVRKGAHMAEYAALCMLAALHLASWGIGGKKLALFSVLFSSFYAATDEFHQLFVEGRSGQVSDVLIDSAGAVMGMLAFVVIGYLVKRHKKHALDELV